jgi:hypothetical protein
LAASSASSSSSGGGWAGSSSSNGGSSSGSSSGGSGGGSSLGGGSSSNRGDSVAAVRAARLAALEGRPKGASLPVATVRRKARKQRSTEAVHFQNKEVL